MIVHSTQLVHSRFTKNQVHNLIKKNYEKNKLNEVKYVKKQRQTI